MSMCVCVSGLEIIYIQVTYLTAPVVQSHPTPPYLNSTTHKSDIHTPGLCSVCLWPSYWVAITQSLFSAATLSHAHIFLVPLFLFGISPRHSHTLTIFWMFLFLMNSLDVPLSHQFFLTFCLSVNVISQLLVKPWKVSACLQSVALSFLCESDRQTLPQWSLTLHMC